MKPSRSKHRLLYTIGLFAALVGVQARAGIDAEVEAVAQDKLLHRATLGVQVISLGNGPSGMREVYARNAHQPLVPASNLKLVTTAAALERLGPDFKFRTTLSLSGPAGGAAPDVVLTGDGDPTLGDAEYLKSVKWRPNAVFEAWAKELVGRGVTTVRDVVVDDGVFDELFVHPDWPADQLDEYYEAQVAGVNYNVNVLDVVVGANGGSVGTAPATAYATFKTALTPGTKRVFSITREPGTNVFDVRGDPPAGGGAVSRTVHDPALFAGTVLSETLAATGVKVAGTVRRDRTLRAKPPSAGGPVVTVVGIHETPIAAVIGRANKKSVNLYAESLCKRIGYDPAKPAVPGSWETGIAGVTSYLHAAGIPDTDFRLADGCGLSKRNAISPRALTRVLCFEHYNRNKDAYLASLSVAGVDGTLEKRFERSDLRRRVFGKSGFVEGVSTVSGYLHSKDGGWYAFSVMINGIPAKSNGQVKLLQERIIKAVDAEAGSKK
ncbi:MAG: dac [Phycisphaerales bacterium]|nr:dac [Phycisphaerales bacterium]